MKFVVALCSCLLVSFSVGAVDYMPSDRVNYDILSPAGVTGSVTSLSIAGNSAVVRVGTTDFSFTTNTVVLFDAVRTNVESLPEMFGKKFPVANVFVENGTVTRIEFFSAAAVKTKEVVWKPCAGCAEPAKTDVDGLQKQLDEAKKRLAKTEGAPVGRESIEDAYYFVCSATGGTCNGLTATPTDGRPALRFWGINESGQGVGCDPDAVVYCDGQPIRRSELSYWWVRNWPVSVTFSGPANRPTRVDCTGHPEKQAGYPNPLPGKMTKVRHPQEGYYFWVQNDGSDGLGAFLVNLVGETTPAGVYGCKSCPLGAAIPSKTTCGTSGCGTFPQGCASGSCATQGFSQTFPQGCASGSCGVQGFSQGIASGSCGMSGGGSCGGGGFFRGGFLRGLRGGRCSGCN